jgi:hypothetical protein
VGVSRSGAETQVPILGVDDLRPKDPPTPLRGPSEARAKRVCRTVPLVFRGGIWAAKAREVGGGAQADQTGFSLGCQDAIAGKLDGTAASLPEGLGLRSSGWVGAGLAWGGVHSAREPHVASDMCEKMRVRR